MVQFVIKIQGQMFSKDFSSQKQESKKIDKNWFNNKKSCNLLTQLQGVKMGASNLLTQLQGVKTGASYLLSQQKGGKMAAIDLLTQQ